MTTPDADRRQPLAAAGHVPTIAGTVVSVRGSVVDIRFERHLPPIYSVLRAGAERQIVIEVLAQRDARHVRGIALTPTKGLARGMEVEDTREPQRDIPAFAPKWHRRGTVRRGRRLRGADRSAGGLALAYPRRPVTVILG